MKPPSDPEHAPLRSFGRLKSRPIKPRQAALLESLLPRIRVPEGPVDPAALAPAAVETWLEIGFGGGEHLAHQAATHPDVAFIGCEVFESGIASGLSHIAEGNLENVRIHPEDARTLLAAMRPQSLDRVFLLFPDPWPKRRHAQRRFIPGNLDRLAELIVPGGEFRIASDDPTYVEWVLQHVPIHPAFQWTAQSPSDWIERPVDAIETRYEKKAEEAGRVPHFFRFRRR